MNTDPGVDRSLSNSSDVPLPPPPPEFYATPSVTERINSEPLPPPPPPLPEAADIHPSQYQGISTTDQNVTQTNYSQEQTGASKPDYMEPEAEIEIHISEDSDNENPVEETSASCYYSTASYNFDPNTTSYASTTWDPPAIAILPSTPAPPISDDDDSVRDYLPNDDHAPSTVTPSEPPTDSNTVPDSNVDSTVVQYPKPDYPSELASDPYSDQQTDSQAYASHVQSYTTTNYSSTTAYGYNDPSSSVQYSQTSHYGVNSTQDPSGGMDYSTSYSQGYSEPSVPMSSQLPYDSTGYGISPQVSYTHDTTTYSTTSSVDPSNYPASTDQSFTGYDQSYQDYSSYSQNYGTTSLNDSGYQTHDAQTVNTDTAGSYQMPVITDPHSTPAPPPIQPILTRKDSWDDVPAVIPPSYEDQRRMAGQSLAQQSEKISAPPPRPAPPTPTRSPVPPTVASSWGDQEPVIAPSYGEAKRAPPPKPPPPRPPPAKPPPPNIAKTKPEVSEEEEESEDGEAWKKFLAQTEGVAKMAQEKLKAITSTTVEKEIKNKHWGIRPESPLKTENIMDSEAPPPRKESADWKPISERLEEEMKKEKDKAKPSRPPPPPPPPSQKRPDLTSIPSWDDPNAHEFYTNVPSYSTQNQTRATNPDQKQNDSESDTGTLKDLTPKDENYNASADLDDFMNNEQNKTNANIDSEIPIEVANWTGFDSEMGLKESESGFFSKLDNRDVKSAFEAFEGDPSEVPLSNGDNLLMQQSYDPFEIGPVDQIIAQVKARTQAEIEAEQDLAIFAGEEKTHPNGNSTTPEGGDKISARPIGFEDEFGAEEEEGEDMSPLFDEDDSQPLDAFPAKFEGDGWNLMLRHPVKKKLMGDRYWKPVFVRLSQGTIQLFHTAKDSRPFHELPLQATYCLSDTVLQQYDIYGKIHTVKLQYVIYKERVGVRPGQIPKLVEGKFSKMGLPLEHAATTTPLLKFGSLEHREISSFVHSVEDVLFHCQTRREQAMVYKQDEVQIHCYDEYEAYVNKEGVVSNQKARVRLFCLAFVSGMPYIEIGLNDRRREGKEIVRRKDIMPMYTDKWIRMPVVLQEELGFDFLEMKNLATRQIAMLTSSQKVVFDLAIKSVEDNVPVAVFVDARGGTGKTFTLNTILAAVRTHRTEKTIAMAVATSGIAAILLLQGRTFHSRFKVPLSASKDKYCSFKISPTDKLAQAIRQTAIIVWDEAPMAHRYLLEGLDRCLRDIMKDDRPFGGKSVILSGDFRQVLPVIERGNRGQITDACFKNSPLWKGFKIVELTENMRIGKTESSEKLKEFDNFLLSIGNGTLKVVQPPDTIEIPVSMRFPIKEGTPKEYKDSVMDFIDATFPSLLAKLRGPEDSYIEYAAERAILAPKNKMVDEINYMIARKFPGKAVTYKSADCAVETEDILKYPIEYLNSLTPNGLPPHILELKKGMILMLLRNMNPRLGLCNGTRLILISPQRNMLTCRIASGDHKGRTVLIPRIELWQKDDSFPFEWKRLQFPVRPAFAITINKSQGQTLKVAGIWLEDSVFTHGQLYVAASRVGSSHALKFAIKESQQGMTRNVVYKEILG